MPSVVAPAPSWMWPKTWNAGLTRPCSSSSRSRQPARSPEEQRSPWPSGGPCVTTTSVPVGICRHLARHPSPRGRLNAHPQNSGCHGLPYTVTPRTAVPESQRYSTPGTAASIARQAASSRRSEWPKRLCVSGYDAPSNVRSWLPAITILRACGCAASHSQKARTSPGRPVCVKSPACTSTSPAGTATVACLLCVSETHTKRTVPSACGRSAAKSDSGSARTVWRGCSTSHARVGSSASCRATSDTDIDAASDGGGAPRAGSSVSWTSPLRRLCSVLEPSRAVTTVCVGRSATDLRASATAARGDRAAGFAALIAVSGSDIFRR